MKLQPRNPGRILNTEPSAHGHLARRAMCSCCGYAAAAHFSLNFALSGAWSAPIFFMVPRVILYVPGT